MMFDLRNWLRRTPMPELLRLRMADGEERMVTLTGGRTRWTVAEESVRTSGASLVEALDGKKQILRSHKLDEDELDPDKPTSAAVHDPKRDAMLLSRDRREIAEILDAQGKRQNEAYALGADAAGKSSDKLLELVDTLTTNLSLAINNLHAMSVNYANVVSANAQNGDAQQGQGEGALALLTTMLGAARAGLPVASAADPNGGKK